jgi:2-oxoglutarate ferredoxin oxidoreductase subunit beta
MINNNIYGMTGGQCSPTTPHDAYATTAPYGNIEPDFNICNLAMGAGASFVARTTAFHVQEMQSMIKDALQHTGFSLIEVISACPVIYGRLNKKGGAPQMLKDFRDNSIPLSAKRNCPQIKLKAKSSVVFCARKSVPNLLLNIVPFAKKSKPLEVNDD